MAKENKEIMKKEKNELATYNASDFGLENVEGRDILLPRLALVHATSKAYAEKKAKIGEMINTSTGKVLAKEGEKIEIIPLRVLPKTYVVSTKAGKWLRTEIMKPGEERNWKELLETTGEKHERTLNFYVLVRKEMGEGAQPYFISFKGGSFKYGQKLINHFTMSGSTKQLPYRKSFDLFAIDKNNATNNWITLDVAEKGNISKEEMEIAAENVEKLKSISFNNVTRYEQESDAETDTPMRDVKPGEVQPGAQF